MKGHLLYLVVPLAALGLTACPNVCLDPALCGPGVQPSGDAPTGPTETPVASTPAGAEAPTASAVPGDCAQLNLTPEECANSGIHTYTWSGTTVGGCFYDEYNPEYTSSSTGTVTFGTAFRSDGSMEQTALEGKAGRRMGGVSGIRVSQNLYSYHYVAVAVDTTGTVKFTLSGFSNVGNDPNPVRGCSWTEEYVLADPAGQ